LKHARRTSFEAKPAKRNNGGDDAAVRIQVGNRQLEIGNDFTPPPLASNPEASGLCGTRSDKSVVFDVLTKDDVHTIDVA